VQNVEVDGLVSGRDGLSVITSGKVTPKALGALGSPHVKQVLSALAAGHDLVLVDSPPVLAFNDALVLAPVVDVALLVLAAGVVRDDEAQRAKRLLEDAGIPVSGIVMNQFDERVHGALLHSYGRSYLA
jgi:Mrp family chromosome partitioning ATPase